jgi:UDP-glucose 4-epimerase
MFKSNLSGTDVLVTGADGFIGKHLISRLINEKANVTAFSQFGLPGELKEKVNEKLIDMEDYSSLLKALKGCKPQKIFHLAGNTSRDRSLENAEKSFKTNLFGTIYFLKALKEHNIAYDFFLFMGTAEEYGDNKAPFTEDQPLDPVSPYSASKASAEMVLKIYWKMYKYPITVLRGFIIYGPGQPKNMLFSQLIEACIKKEEFKMTKGEQKRDFVYVEDHVDAMILASTNPAALGKTFNIASEKPYKIIGVVKKILNLMGNPIKPRIGTIPYRDNEIWNYAGCSGEARKILKWIPKTNLDDGLRKTIDWHLKHKEKIK